MKRMLFAALAALLTTSGAIAGLASPAQGDDTPKPTAVTETIKGLYASMTYDLTDQMLQNDIGNGGVLTIYAITQSSDEHVHLTLKDGRVTVSFDPEADNDIATFTYQVIENGDTTNPSDAVEDTILVKHVIPMVVKRVAGHQAKYTNKNDTVAKVRVRKVGNPTGKPDNVFKVQPHSSVTIPRKHRYQQWGAWLIVSKSSLGYGTV